jgi:hypothetical protein
LYRASTLLLLAAVLGCGTAQLQAASDVTQPAGSGGVRLVVSGSNLLTVSRIARVDYVVGPGAGPFFAPILGQLSGSASGWTASLSGIPAGPRRTIDLTAYDAAGLALYRGGAQADVVLGETVNIEAVLQELSPPGGPTVSIPLIEFLSVSADPVPPGATVTLTAGVGAAPAGQTLSYSWQASCGAFADPTLLTVVWTAPSVANALCRLSFTASTASASATLEVSLTVQPDLSARALAGQRLVTCWEDPPPGYSVASLVSSPAPFVEALAAPQVLVQSSPGAWTSYAGGHLQPDGTFVGGGFGADGSFYIPGIPASAPLLLSFSDPGGVRWLLDTNASAIDLGYDLLGRCDQAPASPTTQVAFNLMGLYPWDPTGSELQATSSNANVWTPLPAPASIAAGAISGTSSLTWAAPLDLFTPSDVLWLHQLTRVMHPDGVAYLAAIASGQQGGVALVDHAANSFDVHLGWLPRTGSLPVSWSPPDFELHLADMAPAARIAPGMVAPHRLSVLAHPYALQAPAPPPPGGSPELVRLELPAGAAALTLSSPLAYARFLPASWLELREVRYAVAVAYQVPGSSAPLYEVSTLGRRDALPVAGGPVVPGVSPVQALTINGAGALLDQAAPVSTTPTFAWSPPALGSPSYYLLELDLLHALAGVTIRTPVARYLTRSTRVALPPGILNAGSLYFARVTALAGAAPYDAAPFRYGPVYSYADALTGTFTP